jgi:hypothetical protein
MKLPQIKNLEIPFWDETFKTRSMNTWINMNELVVIIMTAGLHFLDGSSNVWFFNCLWLLHRTHPKKVDHGHQLKVILSSNHGNFLGIILVKQPFKSKVWKYNRIKKRWPTCSAPRNPIMNNSRTNNSSPAFWGILKNKTTMRLYRMKHVNSTSKSILNIWRPYDS